MPTAAERELLTTLPDLPETAVERPEIIATLKERVLHSQAGANATAVTAPAKKQAGKCNMTTAAGMGGVGVPCPGMS